MSLYRTWRPKSFADLVGQDAVVRTLTHAIESGKLAHAYLFSGPRGSGKTSAAKILARCIDCVNGPTAHPDNTCENCVAMLSGTAMDVLEIDAASNRGIDEIRALRDAVKFAPSSMRMKVYIIDEAHMLTKEGANAFLKTLEEPPAHAVFILATTEPEKLPVTILSRCQRYAFRRISIPVMIERMREIAGHEKIAIDDAALAAIAYRADGGLRDALTMLEQAAAFADGEITTATIELAFGSTGRNFANTLIDAVLAREAATMLRTVEEASDGGADMQVLIRSLIANFRNLLVAKVDPALLSRDLAPEDAERATERAQGVGNPILVRALRVLTDSAQLARTGGNPRLELETALLRLILEEGEPPVTLSSSKGPVGRTTVVERTPSVTLSSSKGEPAPAKGSAAPVGRVAEIEKAPQAPPPPIVTPPSPLVTPSVAKRSRGAAEPAAPTSETAAPTASALVTSTGPITIQKLRAAWMNIRGKVEHERPPLRVPLSGAMVEAIDENAIVIKLRSKLDVDILKEHISLLEKAIHNVLGADLKVRLEIGTTPAPQSTPDETVQFEPPTETADELFGYANERIK